MSDPIRERHRPIIGDTEAMGRCRADNDPWPCDAIRVADERDKALAQVQDPCLERERDAAERERDAARKDADRLAEACEDAREWLASRAVAPEVQGRIDAALRAHDEATR